MDEAYAVKQTQFLGKSVSYVCQNLNGPCPLLAIANVLLLRGQLTLEGIVEPRGYVNASNLMHLIHCRLLDTNPPLKNASELQRLTQEKTLMDIVELLPSMLVGLDVNMKVIGNKSYNELIERLVDYRGVLMTEKASKKEVSVVEKHKDTELSSDTEVTQLGDEEETKPEAALLPVAPGAIPTTRFQNLSIDVDNAPVLSNTTQSPNVIASMSSPTNSPSQQTLQAMMKERHISDADALDTATTLLQEGPVLENFFNSTASQLTFYGLVKLQEGLRERQLCVFFRNNHFSTLFKFDGALYLLVTDAGYLDEPTVVWELLNEIDGDTEYLDAQFRPVTSSEQQKNILTQQQQQREQEKEEEQALQNAQALSLTGCVSFSNTKQKVTSEFDTQATELPIPSGGLIGESAEQSENNLDPDYLLALKFQQEEEELARGNKPVQPRNLQPIVADANRSNAAKPAQTGNSKAEENVKQNDSREQYDGRTFETSANEFVPVAADGQMRFSDKELEAQRQAERYYQEQKRQIDAQTRQYRQEQEQIQQQQLQPQQQIRRGQRRKSAEGSDCTIS
ncbi:hypothetical protein KXD40_004627 [Peronospora effusa]|uniref:MINDY deubiquitinase domain-containing protein n=1 Tax=Peronospora effusa TaxID=542832 RepID=A0A3M6VHZ0_9STRA|nr:hypothetical protein DD238_004382 [Peronospora effusa]UIZ28107.1 hypothetical protein KXD40_004627 [Peronospora effusa]